MAVPLRGRVPFRLARVYDGVKRAGAVHARLVGERSHHRCPKVVGVVRTLGADTPDDGQPVLDTDPPAGDRMIENGYLDNVV